MMLQRSLVKAIVGLALLSIAANLLVFVAAGLTRAKPPLIADGQFQLAGYADPLPQAMVLTAIVIGFGVLAFAISLVQRAFETTGAASVDSLKASE
jgi:multicomponent Na+:H+ antiporter subunit C